MRKPKRVPYNSDHNRFQQTPRPETNRRVSEKYEFPHLIQLPKAQRSRSDRWIDWWLQPIVVAIASLSVSGTCMRASRYKEDSWWGDFWLNLGFAVLGIFLTVALLNVIIERAESRRLSGLREIGYDRLRIQLCRLFVGMNRFDPQPERRNTYSIGMPSIREYRHRSPDHFRLKPGWANYVYRDMIQSHLAGFITWDKEEGEENNSAEYVQDFCQRYVNELREIVATYSIVLNPNQLALLSELIDVTDNIAEEGHWEGYVDEIRGWSVHALSYALLLLETMEPLPDPLHWDNDPRYAKIREERERESKQNS